MLTISVKNFGPIAEGSVDLKPLTIFVGPSNTGKSYMATAVYAVMQGFEGPYHWMLKRGTNSEERGLDILQLKMSSGRLATARNGGCDAVAALIQWASGLRQDELGTRQVPISGTSKELQIELEHSVRAMLGWIQEDVMRKINDTCGEPSSFVRRGLGHQDFVIQVHRREPFLSVKFRVNASHNDPLKFDISNEMIQQPYLETLSNYALLDNDMDRINRLAEYRVLELVDSATEPVFLEIPSRSYFLPASRSGLTQGYKVLSSSIVRQWSSVRILDPNRATLPATTTDFLSNLIDLSQQPPVLESKGAQDTATHFIETSVLNGNIDFDQSGGLALREIEYESPNGKFAINSTSSMVSELAPLILFLKYLINPGDLLILEEPESHLHPAAQRQLARGIVRLVNAGVRVLITTHSDIIVSQINNLLALRQASPELVEQGGFEPEDFLQPDQVGAYLFRHNQELGGCETVDLEIDPDTGIDENEFATVFEAIYDESIALQRDRN